MPFACNFKGSVYMHFHQTNLLVRCRTVELSASQLSCLSPVNKLSDTFTGFVLSGEYGQDTDTDTLNHKGCCHL